MLAKILITGANGQVGGEAVRYLTARGIECTGTDAADMDITDDARVEAVFDELRPGAVLHCGAYTKVDAAETDGERCMAVNAGGSANIARACGTYGAKLLYLSTDYIFDGTLDRPYLPGDAPCPMSVYGRSKLEGEFAATRYCERTFIVRTSWVFGDGANFVRTIARAAREKGELRVVCDQFGSPTLAADLVPLLFDMLATGKYGVYHATNEGYCSWYDFALAIIDELKIPARVIPVTTAEYGAKAKRPQNGRLEKSCLDESGFSRLPHWRDALSRYCASGLQLH